MASQESSSATLIDRLNSFVSEHKKAIAIGATVAVAGGVGYYVYSRSSSGGPTQDSDAKKKKKSGSGKKKGSKSSDGPLLEEIAPQGKADDVPGSPELNPVEILALSPEERTKRAQEYKTRGNAAYQKREFKRAIDLYSKAIAVSSTPEAVYYSNRAACFMNLSPPEYEKVVDDCDKALALDSTYIKALNRRGTALEALDRNEEALRDFTATSILERFQNEATSQTLERTLKKIAVAKTEETLKGREPRLPSPTFINAYFAAFRTRPIPPLPANPSQGDQTLGLAYGALAASDYTHAYTLTNEAIEQGLSSSESRARALNLRGTFKFLIGETASARDDLQESLDLLPSFTQTWVKIASVHMETGEPAEAFKAFETAISYDERDPDIYYHRGQVYFIMQNFDSASEDYNKSTALDDKFVFSHIQYAVAQYKKGESETAKSSFRKAMQQFPESSDVLNYYGELLLDLQRFPDAVEKFDKAIELEKSKKQPMNVLPLVNKALAIYQWQQDLPTAQQLCEEALTIDPECDAAIATLAQLYLQTSQLDEAISMFERHAKIARTSAELEQCFTYEWATRAQKQFAINYPAQAKELEQMAKAMNGMNPMQA